MFRFVSVFLAVCIATASARMAYQFANDIETILSARSYQETFSCEGLPYGYYADMDNNCEIFHICLPIADDIGALVETAHFSFACGNQTVFSQESLTCVHRRDAFPCEESRNLYELSNSEFGIIPVDDFKRK